MFTAAALCGFLVGSTLNVGFWDKPAPNVELIPGELLTEPLEAIARMARASAPLDALSVNGSANQADALRRQEPFTLAFHTANTDWRSDTGRPRLYQDASHGWGSVYSKIELPDLDGIHQSPYKARSWAAEETVKFALPSPQFVADGVYAFTDWDGSGDTFSARDLRVTTKAGLGMKWQLPAQADLQVRGGPVVYVSDSFSVAKPTERSPLSLEVQAKLPIYGPWMLRYTGEALPAVQTTTRDIVTQDLRIAKPFGASGNEFQIGARYRWEDSPGVTPWTERAQLYLRIQYRY